MQKRFGERKFWIVLWASTACNATQALTPTIQIGSIDIAQHSSVTQYTFNLNQSIRYTYTYTTVPARLVLDITPAAYLSCVLPKSDRQASPVQNFRLDTQGQTTRVTFELKYPTPPKIYTDTSSGQYKYHLIVDWPNKQHSSANQLHPTSTINKPISLRALKNHSQPPINLPTPKKVTLHPTTEPKCQNSALKDARLSSVCEQASNSLRKHQDISPRSQQLPKKTPNTILKPKSNRPITIVIDPGHGGKDPGALGITGSQEKTVVLAISKLIIKQLNQDPHYQAHLTRNTDVYLPLRQRLAIARRYNPDLFVAIHADAAYKNSAAGASVFALSERGATSEMARWLAQKENASELVDGVFVVKDRVLRSVLLDLSQSHTIKVSLNIGQSILNQLATMTHLHYSRVEQAAFVVLKSPDIPSLLVETGYLTNSHQEHQLSNPAYQKKMASAIVSGIQYYFLHHPQR